MANYKKNKRPMRIIFIGLFILFQAKLEKAMWGSRGSLTPPREISKSLLSNSYISFA